MINRITTNLNIYTIYTYNTNKKTSDTNLSKINNFSPDRIVLKKVRNLNHELK